MSAIISALLAAIGPLLTQWLVAWLQSLFTKAASGLPEPVPGSESVARAALFDAALNHTPRFAFARRALLRTLKRHADAAVASGLTADAVAEIRDAASAADES